MFLDLIFDLTEAIVYDSFLSSMSFLLVLIIIFFSLSVAFIFLFIVFSLLQGKKLTDFSSDLSRYLILFLMYWLNFISVWFIIASLILSIMMILTNLLLSDQEWLWLLLPYGVFLLFFPIASSISIKSWGKISRLGSSLRSSMEFIAKKSFIGVQLVLLSISSVLSTLLGLLIFIDSFRFGYETSMEKIISFFDFLTPFFVFLIFILVYVSQLIFLNRKAKEND